MAWRDNIHSQLVTCMKIALPLAAMVILSSLFLFSENFDPGDALPIADIDLRQRALDQGATNATFAGLTRSGDAIVLRTAVSKPSADSTDVFLAEDINAKYDLSSGNSIEISAERAEMNQANNSISLSGGVKVMTTTGYSFVTDQLTTKFDDVFAESAGPITGQAPAGDLTAGRMRLEHKTVTGTSHLLFTDGVKLVYQRNLAKDP